MSQRRRCLTKPYTASLAGQTHRHYNYPNTPPRTARRHQSIIFHSCRMRDPTSTPQPLNPLSGIPEGSTRSIGDPLGHDGIDSIDRESPRARSTRSIGDPLGLDRLGRSGILLGSIDSIDRGSLSGQMACIWPLAVCV